MIYLLSLVIVMVRSYWVVPKGLLIFLGFLGNAEFSPWKRLPGFIALGKSKKKKFAGVFVTASDFLFETKLFVLSPFR